MVKKSVPDIRLSVGKNLRDFIKADPSIRTIARFSQLHGSDVRTVKRWCSQGIDSLGTICEVAKTLGIPFLWLILGKPTDT